MGSVSSVVRELEEASRAAGSPERLLYLVEMCLLTRIDHMNDCIGIVRRRTVYPLHRLMKDITTPGYSGTSHGRSMSVRLEQLALKVMLAEDAVALRIEQCRRARVFLSNLRGLTDRGEFSLAKESVYQCANRLRDDCYLGAEKSYARRLRVENPPMILVQEEPFRDIPEHLLERVRKIVAHVCEVMDIRIEKEPPPPPLLICDVRVSAALGGDGEHVADANANAVDE